MRCFGEDVEFSLDHRQLGIGVLGPVLKTAGDFCIRQYSLLRLVAAVSAIGIVQS
jgi:hypothetical protein